MQCTTCFRTFPDWQIGPSCSICKMTGKDNRTCPPDIAEMKRKYAEQRNAEIAERSRNPIT